ncbi:ABC transporter permease [Clostridium sp. UBA5988]|uniref:ABC transporter permease n=1 Tax=Clostridium sp. UBA5988 TaxID=1946369 RepID=UPI00321622A9
MKSFWGIVPRYIIKNKKRVSSIAVGIVLGITLIMSLSIIQEAWTKALIQAQKDWLGAYYDINISTADGKTLDKLKVDDVVNDLAVILPLGSLKVENTKYSIAISGYDENIDSFMNIKFIEGHKPNYDNEIALEQWILDYFPKEYKIGDKIKLKYELGYGSNEEIESEFTLVGIFDYKCSMTDNSSEAIGWVTRNFADKQLENEKIQYNGFINLNPEYSINKGNIELSNQGEYSNIHFQVNYEKVNLLRQIKILHTMSYILFVIFGIVVSIIIYNIFAVSVMERKKQFGILRAMGLSQNRIKALVIIEGVVIGIISIPIGIIIGNTITKLLMISLEYEELFSLLVMPKIGVVSSVVIGLISVLIGTYFPSKKASKISPMEAISESESINFKKNSLSVDNIKFHGKEVRFSSTMAIMNIKRNKKKFITSIISLSVTIVLLLSSYYLIKQADPIESFKNSYGGADFKITTNNAGLNKDSINKISNIYGVSILSKIKIGYPQLYIDKEMITEDGLSYLERRNKGNETENSNYNFPAIVYGYDDLNLEGIKDNIIEGSIDNSNSEPTVIIVQDLNEYNYTNIKVGDEVELLLEKFNDKGEKIGASTEIFKVSAIVDSEKFRVSDGRISVAAILSDGDATKYLDMNGYNIIDMEVDEGIKYEEAQINLESTVKKMREVNLESYKEKYEEIKKQNVQISFVLYSFILIVATISMINLINIMKMNVLMRSKEIGMLRSIGFGIDEVKQMIMVEGVLYGAVSSICGCTLGTLFTYFMHVIGRNTTWDFPFAVILIISLATITVTTLSSVISSKQLFKSSIVDSIRSVE